jgi:hypothetical protein
MSACKTCGREDEGHYIGCVGAAKPLHPDPDQVNTGNPTECSFEGCTAERRSEDKRVKFCETHSDPKNRK